MESKHHQDFLYIATMPREIKLWFLGDRLFPNGMHVAVGSNIATDSNIPFAFHLTISCLSSLCGSL